MKLARTLSDAEAKKIQTLILLGGFSTTIAMWTRLEDPVNLPKMFVLGFFSVIILSQTLPQILLNLQNRSNQKLISTLLIVFFLIGLLVATFETKVKFTAIFGEYHRNNGFLSYFGMTILMFATSLVFDAKSSIKFLQSFSFTGMFLTLYGLFQGLGLDPIGWKIDYNPFITTLGNPNFTSGFLGLSNVALLYLLLEAKLRKLQISYLLSLIFSLYLIKLSGSVQGIFAFLIGASIVLTVKLWNLRKKYGYLFLAFITVNSVPFFLAIFNIGPLAPFLYQGTLRNRIDYWKAAVSMFRDHPIFGVGIDRFGEFYRQYAVKNQVVQGQITDNAHNVYLQLLSTGGLILFIPFLALIFYITLKGAMGFRTQNKVIRIRIASIFGIWVSSLALNLIAVDSLGVAIWFWISGGLLLAITRDLHSDELFDVATPDTKSKRRFESKRRTKITTQENGMSFPIFNLVSLTLVLVYLAVTAPILSNSQSIKDLRENSHGLNATQHQEEVNRQLSRNRGNTQNLILLSDIALRNNEIELSNKISKQIRLLDSRSYYGHLLPAISAEFSGKFEVAIAFREKIIFIDPWNTSNMLQLMKNYLSIGERAKAEGLGKKINLYFPGSQADLDAKSILVE